jgi:hypothetical protein
MKNILVVYDMHSTHTNAVSDHLKAFADHSVFNHYFIHYGDYIPQNLVDNFDALLIHYSVRLPFGFLKHYWEKSIQRYNGTKILFLQDEYDKTEVTRRLIRRLKFDVVFTVVPKENIDKVYSPNNFPDTEFVNCLTGYAIPYHEDLRNVPQISDRHVDVAYRGRALPFWYGDLGQEKRIIAETFTKLAGSSGLYLDISIDEGDRLYGNHWTDFLTSSKVTLGTESGANLFDEEGEIRRNTEKYLSQNPQASYDEVKSQVYQNITEPHIMNQISPRIFEAIAYKTALVLFEGSYSEVIYPGKHYIQLKKDFSNIREVLEKINDTNYLQNLADFAFDDIIVSERFTYEKFIQKYDAQIKKFLDKNEKIDRKTIRSGRKISKLPKRVKPVKLNSFSRSVFHLLPNSVRNRIKNLIFSIMRY